MRTSDEEPGYRNGYYDGFVKAIYEFEKRIDGYMDRLRHNPQFLDGEGNLIEEAMISAHVDAQEDLERYAYSILQEWQDKKVETLPVLQEVVDIVDTERQV